MNRIQNKDDRIGACRINKISLSCFEQWIGWISSWLPKLIRKKQLS